MVFWVLERPTYRESHTWSRSISVREVLYKNKLGGVPFSRSVGKEEFPSYPLTVCVYLLTSIGIETGSDLY